MFILENMHIPKYACIYIEEETETSNLMLNLDGRKSIIQIPRNNVKMKLTDVYIAIVNTQTKYGTVL